MKWYANLPTTEFTIENQSGSTWIVNGEAKAVSIEPRGKAWTLRIQDKVFDVQVLEKSPEEGKVVVAVNGNPVEVHLKTEIDKLVESIGGSSHAVHAHMFLKAPMPGKISRILIETGDTVEVGQPVILLEAMKMENELRAPNSGVVRAVMVQIQDAVEKNALLLEIE